MTVNELIEKLEGIKAANEDAGDYDVVTNDILCGFTIIETAFENINRVTTSKIIQLN